MHRSAWSSAASCSASSVFRYQIRALSGGRTLSSCTSTASAYVIMPTGVSGGSWATTLHIVSIRLLNSSEGRLQSTTRSTAARPPPPSGSSYSIVLCSGRISAGASVRPANEGGSSLQLEQRGHRHRPDGRCTDAKGLRTPEHCTHRTGAFLMRSTPSTVRIGAYSTPNGADMRCAACADSGHRCQERRTPLVRSRRPKSTPGPGCTIGRGVAFLGVAGDTTPGTGGGGWSCGREMGCMAGGLACCE
mmetsp:Transcript_15518/g.38945  ORF Transcript_15518/g.38945 Transcript_15518/m.38945 type:complete len:247 (+) Transcript_15518:2440-3180(+)